jgi:hypothetical protein
MCISSLRQQEEPLCRLYLRPTLLWSRLHRLACEELWHLSGTAAAGH